MTDWFHLKGITRLSIIELARNELNLEIIERVVEPGELATADEIFLTGTAAQIDAVTEYDGQSVNQGDVGTITQQLKHLYRQVTHAELQDYLDWHTIV